MLCTGAYFEIFIFLVDLFCWLHSAAQFGIQGKECSSKFGRCNFLGNVIVLEHFIKVREDVLKLFTEFSIEFV